MRLHDGLIGAGFVIAGAVIFASTLTCPRLEGGHPGPSLFPQVLAGLMVGFSACLLIPAVLRRRGTPPDDVLTQRGIGLRGVVNALLVFAAIIIFMLVAPVLGFLLTTVGILLGLMWWLGTPVLRAVLAALGLTLFVYIIFGKILRVPLPLGILWF